MKGDEREYTFFSERHHTFSRIDLILATKHIAWQIKYIDTGRQIYSAHAPVRMLWAVFVNERPERRWRLDNMVLETDRVSSITEAEIQLFVRSNEESASTMVFWDAFKAYIRGVKISVKAHADKEQVSTREALIRKLEDLDKLNKTSQRIEYYEEYQQLLKKLKVVDTKCIARGLTYGRQKYFELAKVPVL